MATVSLDAFVVHLIRKAEQSRCELNRKKTMLAELRTLEFWRAIIAECLATFIYVFLVCGSHVMWPLYSINTLTKSFTNGLAMATSCQCFGHISGAHLNPAFTFAALVTRKITPLRAFLYMTAQCGGAIAGSALLYGVAVSESVGFRENMGCTVVHDTLTPWQGVGLELVLTFIVVFTMCACADTNRKTLGSDALAVGLAYLVCTLVALPATGASMNPARSLGPAFVSNTWTHHWVYWIGPLSGGAIAGLIYEYIFDSPKKALPSTREDSERDISDIKEDSESKCSSVLTPRNQVIAQSTNQPVSTGPYYRPVTPHDSVRPHSRNAPCNTSTKYISNTTGQFSSASPVTTYYSTLPRGNGYRSWNEYGNSSTQFKF